MGRFKYYADRYRIMSTVIFENVDECVKKVVKNDGRIGGMQNMVGDEVHVVTTIDANAVTGDISVDEEDGN